MKIEETRRKRYVLSVEDTSAMKRVLDILDRLENDDDICDIVENSAQGNICDAVDILRAVLNNDCEEIEIEED